MPDFLFSEIGKVAVKVCRGVSLNSSNGLNNWSLKDVTCSRAHWLCRSLDQSMGTRLDDTQVLRQRQSALRRRTLETTD